MNYIVIGSSGFIGNKVYASLKIDPNNNVMGISSNQVDLSNKDSFKKLNSIVKADNIIIMCAGVKKQLGDNIDVFEKNLIIINNFIRVILNVRPKKSFSLVLLLFMEKIFCILTKLMRIHWCKIEVIMVWENICLNYFLLKHAKK